MQQKSKKRQDKNRKQGKENRKKMSYFVADPRNCLKTALGSSRVSSASSMAYSTSSIIILILPEATVLYIEYFAGGGG